MKRSGSPVPWPTVLDAAHMPPACRCWFELLYGVTWWTIVSTQLRIPSGLDEFVSVDPRPVLARMSSAAGRALSRQLDGRLSLIRSHDGLVPVGHGRTDPLTGLRATVANGHAGSCGQGRR
jgi:hypothetical protein